MDHQAGAVYVYERNDAGEWEDRGELVSEPDALPPLLGEVRECTDGKVGPFDCDGIDLLAFIPGSMLKADGDSRGVRTNDNWGWTDPLTGREYAIIGRNDGTSFFDITDPINPLLIGDLPKTGNTPPSQLWRDIKFYNGHAFIVADGAGAHDRYTFQELSPDSMSNPRLRAGSRRRTRRSGRPRWPVRGGDHQGAARREAPPSAEARRPSRRPRSSVRQR